MAKIFPTDFEEKLTIAQDDYILFSDSEDNNKIKKAQYSNLKGEKGDTWPQWPQGIQGIQWPQWETWATWPQGEQGEQWEQGIQWPTWPQGETWATGNWIADITSSKSGKKTTVTITETNGTSESFEIYDWADGQWAWDVTWPNWAVDGHLAVFDGNTGKIIKDWWAIPQTTVVDSLDSTSATSALSANQGKLLNDKINDLFWQWKFLSLWNCATGQPLSFPYATPYAYSTGDYYLIEVVDTTTNYRPNGSSYTGTASSTAETDEVEQWDVYIYDWAVWLLQSNHWKTVAFANIAGLPSDNTALSTALWEKQNTLVSGTNIKTINNQSILGSGNINIDSSTVKQFAYPSVWSDITDLHNWLYTSGVATKKWAILSSWTWANESNYYEVVYFIYAMWEGTINAERSTNTGIEYVTIDYSLSGGVATVDSITSTNTWVTSVNWQTWAVTVEEWDSKVFAISDLTSAASLATATQAYTYAYTTGKCAIIRYSNANYVYALGSSSAAYFTRAYGNWAVSSGAWAVMNTLKLTVSSWSVTAIVSDINQISISSTAPSSSGNNVITLVI